MSKDGRHYRERARECHLIAEILATVKLREKMLRIAADYERMAEAADKSNDDSADAGNLRTLRGCPLGVGDTQRSALGDLGPGMPTRGAWDALHDVDNRLKTIFDALRMAKGPKELGGGTTQGTQRPTSDEDPFLSLGTTGQVENYGAVSIDWRFQIFFGYAWGTGTEYFRMLQRSLRPMDSSPRPGWA